MDAHVSLPTAEQSGVHLHYRSVGLAHKSDT